jgi:ankyrin repeat protein
MYEKRRSRSTGWVELARLERLPPDAKTLAARQKWQHNTPDGHPLILAAIAGDALGLRKAAAAPDVLRKHGHAALYAAARSNQYDTAVALLDLGVNPNGVNSCQQFTGVAGYSSPRILELLVSRGADVNCRTDRERRTPLMGAAATDRGMDIVFQAMGHARENDPMASAKLLLAKGARVDDLDVWGGSALRIAIEPNNVDIATLLLEAGADVNNYVDDSTSIGEQSGNTSLMSAISWFSLRRDPTMIRLLLQHRADVNYRNVLEYDEECDKTTSGKCTFRGQTALTRATSDGYYTVVKLLLESGADPLLPRTDDKAPTEIACERNEVEIAELIEQYVSKRLGAPQTDAPCTINWTPRRRSQ